MLRRNESTSPGCAKLDRRRSTEEATPRGMSQISLTANAKRLPQDQAWTMDF